jgi:putative ABC transport system ATP-binding protein
MSSEIAVQCLGVTKEFGNGAGKVLALRGVDLNVRYGQMTLLVGPSGCGKTTLLSVIAGLLNTTKGEITVLGEKIERLSGRQQILFRRKNLGFVFQQYNLLPALTAAENGAVPLLAAEVPRRQAIEEAERLLTKLGMGDRKPEIMSRLDSRCSRLMIGT